MEPPKFEQPEKPKSKAPGVDQTPRLKCERRVSDQQRLLDSWIDFSSKEMEEAQS